MSCFCLLDVFETAGRRTGARRLAVAAPGRPGRRSCLEATSHRALRPTRLTHDRCPVPICYYRFSASKNCHFYSSVLGTNSRGLSVRRGQTFGELGGFTEDFGVVGVTAVDRAASEVFGVGRAFLKPARPCLVQYRRKVSYEAGNGGDALRYAAHTRHIVCPARRSVSISGLHARKYG